MQRCLMSVFKVLFKAAPGQVKDIDVDPEELARVTASGAPSVGCHIQYVCLFTVKPRQNVRWGGYRKFRVFEQA